MITETTAHHCRHCQSQDIVKNGTNACHQAQYHCKTCGVYGVLQPKVRYTEAAKEIIIKAIRNAPACAELNAPLVSIATP
ncbi:MAG: hypothetical protein V3U75_06695 [Methylococcaceae bacterium]